MKPVLGPLVYCPSWAHEDVLIINHILRMKLIKKTGNEAFLTEF